MPIAEQNYRLALAIQERLVPPDDVSLVQFVAGLGGMLYGQGRYDEAEPFMRRSLRYQELIAQNTGNEQGLAVALYMLGSNYSSNSRLAEGLRLLEKALAAFERSSPQGSLQAAFVLNNLATNRQFANDYPAAIRYQQRALELFQRFSPGNVPGLAKINNNLAFLFHQARDFENATAHFELALSQLHQVFPSGHPDTATALLNYGGLLLDQGRQTEAETRLNEALTMYKRWLPADHPEIALAYIERANLWFRRRNWHSAADDLRKAADIHIARSTRQEAGRGSTTGSDVQHNALTFRKFVKAVHRMTPSDAQTSFVMAQHALGSAAAASLAQMAARGASGDPRLSGLARARQDLVAQWHALDRALVASLIQPAMGQQAATESLQNRLTAVDVRISEMDRTLAAQFPDYAALASPAPLLVEQVQADLRPDEALVLFLDTPKWDPTPEETFVWVVTKTVVRWVRSNLGTPGLTREVGALRCGLDATAWYGNGALRCSDLLKRALDTAPKDGDPLPFESARAYDLYMALFGEVADLIKGKHLLLIPSGPLTKLPFQVLVTERPKGRDTTGVHWLVRDHALTVLPSVSSLKALRRIGKPSAAPRPMIGFANPLLDGPQQDPTHGAYFKQLASLAKSQTGCAGTFTQKTAALRSITAAATLPMLRRGITDVADLRAQSPLPETTEEVCAVARDLDADVGAMRIGARATEAEVKALSASGELARYRILHFATHGTLAGELRGSAEPGLILTPPQTPTTEDDGYLTGSEIASLKLDADWVILSACNTAGGADAKAGAEALSGLARAFFYAGARALLVSHWAVNSQATVRLITTAAREIKDHNAGRAEALRRAMLAMIDSGDANATRPAYWAPFVVVGEGAAQR